MIFTSVELEDFLDDVISFCNLQLLKNHPRDDYQELSEIFLGSKSSRGKRFGAPGLMD